jgi:hypothetical protein
MGWYPDPSILELALMEEPHSPGDRKVMIAAA